MNKNYEFHTVITGISEEMKDDLPKGFECEGNTIKVPDSRYQEYYDWCVRHGIGNGFAL